MERFNSCNPNTFPAVPSEQKHSVIERFPHYVLANSASESWREKGKGTVRVGLEYLWEGKNHYASAVVLLLSPVLNSKKGNSKLTIDNRVIP